MIRRTLARLILVAGALLGFLWPLTYLGAAGVRVYSGGGTRGCVAALSEGKVVFVVEPGAPVVRPGWRVESFASNRQLYWLRSQRPRTLDYGLLGFRVAHLSRSRGVGDVLTPRYTLVTLPFWPVVVAAGWIFFRAPPSPTGPRPAVSRSYRTTATAI